jgi:bifunctional DNase/RNase
MELSRVLILDASPEQFITLTECGGTRSFAIKIGTAEAMAIERRLRGQRAPRPQTHDLLEQVIETLGAELERIVVHHLDGGTYYANLILRRGDDLLKVDARPSDAIALGVGLGTPIEVAESVLELAGEEPPEVEPPIETGEGDDDDE